MVSNVCKDWLKSAQNDFIVIHSIIEMVQNPRRRPHEQVLYHSQQAAEKALKAYLYNCNLQPWGHDLNALRTDCSKLDNSFNTKRIVDHCAFLQAYSVARYPDYTDKIDASVASRGINSAKRIYDFIAVRLGIEKCFSIDKP